MILNFKNFLKRLLPYYLWLYFLYLYHKIKFGILNIYSCRGVIDKKLKKIIGEKKDGFVLEVGAYHGYSESVSLRFENEFGWKGLLIEPNPTHFKYLKKNRSHNICLNFICLSKKFLKKKVFVY